MNHSEFDIEELTRSQLQGAESTPPDGVWTRIGAQLAQSAGGAAASKTPQGGLLRRAGFWLASAAVLAAGSVALAVVLSLRDTSPSLAAVENSADGEPLLIASSQQGNDVVAAEDIAPPSAAATPAAEKVSASAVQAQPQAPTQVLATQTAPAPQPVATLAQADNATTAPPEAEEPDEQPLAEIESGQIPQSVAPTQEQPSVDNPSAAPSAEQVRREVDATLLLSNVLTPNGDGINDCWVIQGLENYSHVQVQVFTGHGKRVYSSANYQNDFCGGDLPDGNYFYFITIREKNYTRRGALVIRR